MNAHAGVGMIACPSCGVANAQAAKFCGSCGAGMGAQGGPLPPPPPQPPPFPPQPPMSRFNVGGMGAMGADDIHSVAPMTPAQTFEHVGRTVMGIGGRVLGQSPPSSMQIEIPYSSFWYTGGMTIRYRGMMSFAPQGAQQTLVQGKLAVDWGSAGLLCGAIFLIGLIGGVFNPYFFMMSLIFGAACAGITAWMMTSITQRRAAEKLLGALTGAPVAAAKPKFDMPNMGGANPFQQRAPQQPPQQAPQTAAAAEPSPIEQLEKLAKLRDAGVVTAEEFEAKKAEIMKRI